MPTEVSGNLTSPDGGRNSDPSWSDNSTTDPLGLVPKGVVIPLAYEDLSSDAESELEYQQFEIPDTIPGVRANEDGVRYKHEEVATLVRELGDVDKPKNEESNTPVAPVMAARAYQIEMFQKSLESNIVVMMETGSGKTQVAILRMQHFLDLPIKIEEQKPAYVPESVENHRLQEFVWFVTPTVALANQQASVIKQQIPSVGCRLLTGSEEVDTWSSRNIWTSALEGCRIVVSTPQVLCDALDHAFILLSEIGLLIFDEAHNCVGKSAGSRIMWNHYHPAKESGIHTPCILGLSASPSMDAGIKNIESLEKLLDAVCLTPVAHRDELIAHTNRPQIQNLMFDPPQYNEAHKLPLPYKILSDAFDKYRPANDPGIRRLLRVSNIKEWKRLSRVLTKKTASNYKTLVQLSRRMETIYDQFGSWACQMYMYAAVSRLLAQREARIAINEDISEYNYMHKLMGSWEPVLPPPLHEMEDSVTHKMRVLIDFLLTVPGDSQGIIFATERTSVVALAELINAHPELKKTHRAKTMFGVTHSSGRVAIWDTSQNHPLSTKALEDFRNKKVNIIVSTTVLEEGIDVPACNLVICYDPPDNFKSFVQRRGRARSHESRLFLFVPTGEQDSSRFTEQERAMQEYFADQDLLAQRIAKLEEEAEMEEMEASRELVYIHPKSGARMDLMSAKSHLNHFCGRVCSAEFSQAHIEIIYTEDMIGEVKYYNATIILPPVLPAELRSFQSSKAWRSQRHAGDDGCFHAVLTLERLGFLNHSFLPLSATDFAPDVEARISLISVPERIRPWPTLAQLWEDCQVVWSYELTIKDSEGTIISGSHFMSLPVELDGFESFPVHLSEGQMYHVSITKSQTKISMEELKEKDHTVALLTMAYGHRFPLKTQKGSLPLVRFWHNDTKLQLSDLATIPVDVDALQRGEVPPNRVIRDREMRPYLFNEVVADKPDASQVHVRFRDYVDSGPLGEPYVSVRPWSRRTDFFHKLLDSNARPSTSLRRYRRVFPASWLSHDNVSDDMMLMGTLVPSLIHEVAMMMTAWLLRKQLSPMVELRDLTALRTAISARSASERYDYERLEFLGDSMLKFLATMNVSSEKLDWPEGYLTMKKDNIVSNSRLYKLTVRRDLGKFLTTRSFTGRSFVPPFSEDWLDWQGPVNQRWISSKTLADVAESLIGVAFDEGGMALAIKMLSCLFYKKYKWVPEGTCRQLLYNNAPDNIELGAVAPLERVIGYNFGKKSLLVEAVTHPSYLAVSPALRSFDRLEFLGDAVIDRIVVDRLFHHPNVLPNSTMHTIKSALVNGDFLAYLCLSHSVEINGRPTSIWDFIRKSSYTMSQVLIETQARYELFGSKIHEALWHGKFYPWGLLYRLQARKFYSDVIESIVGAMYIDQGGLEPCIAILERFGIFDLMRHLLEDGVEVIHPKERLSTTCGHQRTIYYVRRMPGPKGFTCQVFVDGVCWADVEGGVDSTDAKIEAAHQACENMKTGTHLMVEMPTEEEMMQNMDDEVEVAKDQDMVDV